MQLFVPKGFSAINHETLMKSADLLIKFGVNIHHLNNNQ